MPLSTPTMTEVQNSPHKPFSRRRSSPFTIHLRSHPHPQRRIGRFSTSPQHNLYQQTDPLTTQSKCYFAHSLPWARKPYKTPSCPLRRHVQLIVNPKPFGFTPLHYALRMLYNWSIFLKHMQPAPPPPTQNKQRCTAWLAVTIPSTATNNP